MGLSSRRRGGKLGWALCFGIVDGEEELDVTVQLQKSPLLKHRNVAPVVAVWQWAAVAATNTQGQQVQLADVAEVQETTGPDVIIMWI